MSHVVMPEIGNAKKYIACRVLTTRSPAPHPPTPRPRGPPRADLQLHTLPSTPRDVILHCFGPIDETRRNSCHAVLACGLLPSAADPGHRRSHPTVLACEIRRHENLLLARSRVMQAFYRPPSSEGSSPSTPYRPVTRAVSDAIISSPQLHSIIDVNSSAFISISL